MGEAPRVVLPTMREHAGLLLASSRLERFNDWTVSIQCVHRGTHRKVAGVAGLDSLEEARRSRELPRWRAKRSLPAWEVKPCVQLVA
jgi:hypothetical protein